MIPKWVNKYIGLEFEKYNCWQLICLVYKNELKIDLPTYKNEYSDAMDKENIGAIYKRELQIWKRIQDPQNFDIVVCRILGQPWHAGLVVDKNEMLHTEKNINTVIERYDRIIWKNRIIGFYRYYKR